MKYAWALNSPLSLCVKPPLVKNVIKPACTLCGRDALCNHWVFLEMVAMDLLPFFPLFWHTVKYKLQMLQLEGHVDLSIS